MTIFLLICACVVFITLLLGSFKTIDQIRAEVSARNMRIADLREEIITTSDALDTRDKTIAQLERKYKTLNDLKEAEQQARDKTIAQLERKYKTLNDLKEAEQQARDLATRWKQIKCEWEAESKELANKVTELESEVSLLEDTREGLSVGLYTPTFSFQDSTEYKLALADLRMRIKAAHKAGHDISNPVKWTVSRDRKTSKGEGDKLVKLNSKALLRAFNGECDAALSNVVWDNIEKMLERLRKCYTDVNKLGEVLSISITPQYLELRLNEIRLAHEYEQKKHDEQQERRVQQEKLREEAKAMQEIEEIKEAAESQEEMYNRLLEQARKEATEATGAQLAELTSRVASFEAKLDEARQRKERAISRAQFTKSGFVYVISNIGAFGEGVFKIGMTRRMEPMDRIAELSGASVPFPFDLHAMMYSDNAPELENALHKLFDDRRLNLVNTRKEFFHQVELSEIEAFIKERGLSAQFVPYPEARAWRETLALREQRSEMEQFATPEPELTMQ